MKFRMFYLSVFSLFIGILVNFISYAQPNLETPANNTLNYNFTKVTYTWDTVGNATSYDLQVSNDSSSSATYVKTYSGLDTNAYTPPSDYLNFNTQYFWRVRAKVNGVSTDFSDYFLSQPVLLVIQLVLMQMQVLHLTIRQEGLLKLLT